MDEILKIAVTAIVTTLGTFVITRYTLANNAKNELQQRRGELERHAHYLAVRVICMLDPFVSACCDVAGDSGMPDSEGNMEPQVSLPTLALPEDVDWKTIPTELMYRILSLPNDIDIARQTIDFVGSEIASPPDYDEAFEERAIQFGKLGLTALALCDEMRAAYSIPQRSYSGWHPKEALTKAIAQAQELQSKRSAHLTDIMPHL